MKSRITLKSVSAKEIVDMGQCMCPVNCAKKLESNESLTHEIAKIYTLKKVV